MRSLGWPKLVWAVLGIATLIIAACFVAPSDRALPQGIVWIKPSEWAHYITPGPFTRLKDTALRLLPASFWRWYMSQREQISIDSRLLTLTTESARRTEPASQCWTNAQGMRAWILSAEDLASLRQQLKNPPGATTANAMRLTTYDGGRGQMSVGSSAPAPNSVFIGLTIDLLPRVAGSSFNVLVGAISTDAASTPDGTTTVARTNFAATCQAFLPNGGCLVLDVGKGKDSSLTSCWLVISPQAIDRAGNSKKL